MVESSNHHLGHVVVTLSKSLFIPIAQVYLTVNRDLALDIVWQKGSNFIDTADLEWSRLDFGC